MPPQAPQMNQENCLEILKGKKSPFLLENLKISDEDFVFKRQF